MRGSHFRSLKTPPCVWLVLLLALPLALLQGCTVKPNPISPVEHQLRVDEDRRKLYENQIPLNGPLTLEMAIARALKYNYDHRLAVMEAAFHDQELTAATYAMLPRLAANAGYTYRDNEAASSSISYRTRQQTLEPSVSTEQDKRTADLTLTWTALDFGLSYFQAKQQSDRLLIMLERKRRVVNNMVKEVIAAYWKVHTADRLMPKLDKAIKRAEQALATYERMHKERLGSPRETLEQHRDLLSIVNHLRRIKADLGMARIKLSALINVPLDTKYTLLAPGEAMMTPPPLPASLAELENKGLAMRSDLREEAYQERIDKLEVYKEIIRMLPGVSLFAGINYDVNKFLVHEHWNEVGARVTMNLFGLISGPMQIKAAETKADVTRTRRLAQTVAALVQINLSYHQYKLALDEYQHLRKISRLEDKIYTLAQSEHAAQAQDDISLIRHSVNALRVQIERDNSLVDIYHYWGNMYFSLGGDIIPVAFANEDLESMARTIQNHMHRWWKGDLPFEQPANQ